MHLIYFFPYTRHFYWTKLPTLVTTLFLSLFWNRGIQGQDVLYSLRIWRLFKESLGKIIKDGYARNLFASLSSIFGRIRVDYVGQLSCILFFQIKNRWARHVLENVLGRLFGKSFFLDLDNVRQSALPFEVRFSVDSGYFVFEDKVKTPVQHYLQVILEHPQILLKQLSFDVQFLALESLGDLPHSELYFQREHVAQGVVNLIKRPVVAHLSVYFVYYGNTLDLPG